MAIAGVVVLVLAGLAAGCASAPTVTPTISPGTANAPRDVNLIALDRSFAPAVVDLVPGETIVLHVINGGLEVHEAVIGGRDVQDAWEAAEAAVAGAPPGPTPVVSVPPDRAGLRIVVRSGQLVDVVWPVPAHPFAASTGQAEPFLVGCHIPGHYAAGMVVPVRWIGADGHPLTPAVPSR